MGKELSVTIKSAGLGFLLEKPVFLKEKDEKKLMSLLEKKKYDEFYDYGSKIIKSSSDVRHLYIYIKSKLEKKGIFDELVDEKSKMILQEKGFGYLGLRNPVLEKYLGNKVNKKDLEFFEEYKKYIGLEEKFDNSVDFDEKEVLDYFNFIRKSLENKRIDEDMYSKAYKFMSLNLIATKQNGEVLGSLVSEELQEKLGFEKIYSKIRLDLDD